MGRGREKHAHNTVENVYIFFTFPNLLEITSCGLFEENYDQISRIRTFHFYNLVDGLDTVVFSENKQTGFFFLLDRINSTTVFILLYYRAAISSCLLSDFFGLDAG